MNVQEMPTDKLVEIVRELAGQYQKPESDDAAWRELLIRYRWQGCPNADFIFIGSLDTLLRPLNGGWTMLPPTEIQIPGSGIAPPPPHYQKKVASRDCSI